LINRLKEKKIDIVEYLSSTATTRAAAGVLGNITTYLADPASPSKLARVYQVWRRAWRDEEQLKGFYSRTTELLRKCVEVESFVAPWENKDWLGDLRTTEPVEIIDELEAFRVLVKRWLGTTLLPIDQMILTLAQDLFIEPADLALAHKLALVLRQASIDHAEWRLPELSQELAVVARNERRFLGFSNDDSGFDPEKYRGKVVVSTMHKAKGLEWDKVYLMSVNNYDFPSGMPNDVYISEKWFSRGGLNLEAEALASLDNALSTSEFVWQSEGEATLKARTDYVRERLRLLYVGITRAKLELVITWNTGRQGTQTQALPFAALQGAVSDQ
jgi:DNA helicase II / ATP-dependent DNA helicase PcrA